MSGILTPSVIANEALLVLSNNLVAASLVYRGDTSTFTGAKVGDTITIRRPANFSVQNFSTTIAPQGVNEGSVAMTLERHFDMSIELTSRQLTLNLEDFSEQVVRPAMVNFAEQIDSYIYSKYVELNEFVGDGNLNALTDLTAVDQRLMELKVPMSGRVGFLSPLTRARFLALPEAHRQDIRGERANPALTEASMGRLLSVDWYGAQGVVFHTAGVPGGTPTGTGTAGSTSVSVAAGGAAGTFRQGDIVTFAGHSQTYVVTANATLNGSGAGTINIFPALVQAVSGAAITVAPSHWANIVGHPRGLSVACVPLELPMEGDGAVVNYGGWAIRVVRRYDIQSKKNLISFDTLVGAKVTDPRLLVRYAG